MDEFERGFILALILGEGGFGMSSHGVPSLQVFNTDTTILEYTQQILQKTLNWAGYKPISIILKKGKENLSRKKPVYYIKISGRRLKKLVEVLPELSRFTRVHPWIQKIEHWSPTRFTTKKRGLDIT